MECNSVWTGEENNPRRFNAAFALWTERKKINNEALSPRYERKLWIKFCYNFLFATLVIYDPSAGRRASVEIRRCCRGYPTLNIKYESRKKKWKGRVRKKRASNIALQWRERYFFFLSAHRCFHRRIDGVNRSKGKSLASGAINSILPSSSLFV